MNTLTPQIDFPQGYLTSQGLSETFPTRFWQRVFITPSHWLWEGNQKESGHGTIWRGMRNPRTGLWQWLIHAHVASWILCVGPIPKGKFVLHQCPGGDIPFCINPEHLYVGSRSDNQRDIVRAGKCWIANHPFRGETNPSAKLTAVQVLEIRAKYATGQYSQPDLASEFRVTQANIWLIVHQRNWRSLGV